MSSKGYKHLTAHQRIEIAAYIMQNFSVRKIAKKLYIAPSTVTRELERNSRHINGKGPCPIHKGFYLCNNCERRKECQANKVYYNYELAQRWSKERLKMTRSGIRANAEELEYMNTILYYGINVNKQGLHHVYESDHIVQGICCEHTVRNYIYKKQFKTGMIDLKDCKKLKHKPLNKPKRPEYVKDPCILVNHDYSCFIKYLSAHYGANIVQLDSLEGKKGDSKAILVFSLPKYHFHWGMLIEKGNAMSVYEAVTSLFIKLGKEIVAKIFNICLCDNGIEFNLLYNIERYPGDQQIVHVFYTRPHVPTDKTSCERENREARNVFPKYTSFEKLTQDIINFGYSNLNSTIYASLGNRYPYDLVYNAFGQEFLDKIGIKRIDAKKVRLVPLI